MTHQHSYTAAHIPGRRLLHAPGPTPLPEAVQDALKRQPLDLADERVSANIATCEQGIAQIVQTDADVFFYACNGHGAWEAVIENLLPIGGKALICGTGHFSDGWAIQTEGLGRQVVRTAWREGFAIDTQALTDALLADLSKEIIAVFAVHTDTASSITSDLDALRRAIDAADHPALLVVDVVASLAVVPIAMTRQGINVLVGASQKGLMTPPGVGIVVADAAAQAVAANNPAPRFYWDWRLRRNPLSYRKFCGTAPQNLMFGLEAALGLIFQEGLPALYARHALLAGAVRAAVQGWAHAGALAFFAQEPGSRSNSVTTITVPEGTDVDALRQVARERFQVAFAGGLGPLAGRCFRIGHMGDQNPALVLGALGAVQAALQVQGVPCGRDGVARAIDYFARSAQPHDYLAGD